MPSDVVAANGFSEAPGLSQGERVADVFFAPSKTFADILRNQSWWLPFLLIAIFSLAQGFAVQRQVGFERVNENQIHSSPKREDAFNQMSPEQRATQLSIGTKITAGINYAFPLLLLLGYAFYALILWASFNFLLGSETRYGQVFAVCVYASLPYLLLVLLTIISLFVGGNAENFDYKYPVGTNLGYFLPDVAPWLRALLARLDIIQIWTLVLTTLGMAIVARKTMMQAAMVVVGWWLAFTLFAMGGAAFSG